MTNEQVAKAFAAGHKARSANARTDGQTYWLFDNAIARKRDGGRIVHFDWCGWHTSTTGRHLNLIFRALGNTAYSARPSKVLLEQFDFAVNNGRASLV